MKGIKVLTVNKRHYPLKELEGYYLEIKPKFNRDGFYYNRHEGVAWIELQGRAWFYDKPSYFLYSLKMLNHKPLTDKCVLAIKDLIRAGIKNKELNELLYTDTCYKQTRLTWVRSTLRRNKIFKNRKV